MASPVKNTKHTNADMALLVILARTHLYLWENRRTLLSKQINKMIQSWPAKVLREQ
jgi:hypothetical protein